ncbi:MAG: hypothetical protein Q4A74_05020 [Cardiobacteriaceae bacterium]|nr:hypothetical protein [Cardiobacteriaceae bacterium]
MKMHEITKELQDGIASISFYIMKSILYLLFFIIALITITLSVTASVTYIIAKKDIMANQVSEQAWPEYAEAHHCIETERTLYFTKQEYQIHYRCDEGIVIRSQSVVLYKDWSEYLKEILIGKNKNTHAENASKHHSG